MLIAMECKNFKSFKEKATLSMEMYGGLKRRKGSHIISIQGKSLLKSAYIIGPNGSGKSNVLSALVFLSKLIQFPTGSETESLLTNTFAHNEDPTVFTVVFIKNEKAFSYSLTYDASKVIEERLQVNDELIFSKVDDEINLPKQLLPLKDTIRRNQLLLYVSQTYNVEEAKEAYEWFAKDIIFITPNSDFTPQLLKLQNTLFKRKILLALQGMGFFITDIHAVAREEVVPISERYSPVKNKSLTRVDVFTTHQDEAGHRFDISLGDESVGTRVLLKLCLYLFDDMRDKVFLIDDFDVHLHKHIVDVLLQLFNQWNHHSQFIVTTHNIDFLDGAVQSDQIWFTAKKSSGESELYRLSSLDVEIKRKGYKKPYLLGQYGAVPVIDETILCHILGIDQNK